jgi:hypothetical protein
VATPAQPTDQATGDGQPTPVRPWTQIELELTGHDGVVDPYLGVDAWADFEHEDGQVLTRPAFWDGGRTWRIRFAATSPGRWRWSTRLDSGATAPGLTGQSGEVIVDSIDAREADPFRRHGFWQMSAEGRSLVHRDGTPALIAADTAWALPWRATAEQAVEYAADRAGKGFNAALLMSVQPDMRAEGPRDRTLDKGFGVGFGDLPTGHLNDLVVEYFQYLDVLLGTLVGHGIVPVLQPVFQGFGWKGLDAAGTVVPPAEYARYCRYLVARYGAIPVVWLVGADGSGEEPQVEAGGVEVHARDCYGHPTGIHYRPHARNAAHQDADWLDFQWCQTGHGGEHVQERVADMHRNTPVKAIANGEPSYEHTGWRGNAEGWWQGHEAWSNLFAGGTMGVVYGAASLWQWRLHADEPGHSPYFLAPGAGWREAVAFEGSTYVGLLRQILDGLPTTDMVPDWTLAVCPRLLRAPSGLVLAYQEYGGDLRLKSDAVPLNYRVIDPRTGRLVDSGVRSRSTDPVPDSGGHPRLYICDPA